MRIRSVGLVVVLVCALCGAGCGEDPAQPLAAEDGAPSPIGAAQYESPTCSGDNPYCCRHVSGTFTDVFLKGPDCAPLSPIEQCTRGALTGDLQVGYDFFFETQTPLSNDQQTFQFTGVSRITAPGGTMKSDDHGQIRFLESGTAPFTTFVEITEGTGVFDGAQGTLVAQGTVDLATSNGSGTWEGVICVPNRTPTLFLATFPKKKSAEGQ